MHRGMLNVKILIFISSININSCLIKTRLIRLNVGYKRMHRLLASEFIVLIFDDQLDHYGNSLDYFE